MQSDLSTSTLVPVMARWRGWKRGGAFLLAVCIAHPAFASKRLVTVNLHPTSPASNCNATTCDENVTPPLSNLASFARIGGSAFHIASDCQALQARCGYAHNGRTKILSSDAEDADPLDAQGWISKIKESNHPVGRIHFEHLDKCLSNWAVDNHPMLTGLSSFPTAEECLNEYGISI
ncbi:MAG: hypothetical protein J5I93_07760, partial [Pirellulaceae bacterium]|nr:hypothetical protein [Pirellulaceae bacterium]